MQTDGGNAGSMKMNERNENYILHEQGNVKWLTFPQLEVYPELVHGFTTRHSGVSTGDKTSWNFGKGPDETWSNITENYKILSGVLNPQMDPEEGIGRMVRTDQTHTANIRMVTEEDLGKGIIRGRDYTDIDGLVTSLRDVMLITSHGDCNALYFYDPVQQVIGLAHSGWKGTLRGIGAEMIRIMKEEYACQPEDMVVGIGPALCQDCFEVDEDVAQMFYEKKEIWRAFAYQRGVKHYIDLKAIVRDMVMAAGVRPKNIHDMKLCTKCVPGEELFFSYRRQKGKNGNMAAAMMLKR